MLSTWCHLHNLKIFYFKSTLEQTFRCKFIIHTFIHQYSLFIIYKFIHYLFIFLVALISLFCQFNLIYLQLIYLIYIYIWYCGMFETIYRPFLVYLLLNLSQHEHSLSQYPGWIQPGEFSCEDLVLKSLSDEKHLDFSPTQQYCIN